MQIVYYYIEELNDIKQQNINFGDKYIFNYDPITKELTAEENELYIENFYGDNINITAIIGENGSGKTSLIKNLMGLRDILTYEQNFILISKDNENYTLHSSKIEYINLTNIKFVENDIVIKYDNINETKITEGHSPVYKDSNIIYYNNIFDLDENILYSYNNYNNTLINISSKATLNSLINSNNYNLFTLYNNEEISKIIAFLNKEDNKFLNAKFPNDTKIRIIAFDTFKASPTDDENYINLEKLLHTTDLNLNFRKEIGFLYNHFSIIKYVLKIIQNSIYNGFDEKLRNEFEQTYLIGYKEYIITNFLDKIKTPFKDNLPFISKEFINNVLNIYQDFIKRNSNNVENDYKRILISDTFKTEVLALISLIDNEIMNGNFTYTGKGVLLTKNTDLKNTDLFEKISKFSLSPIKFEINNISSGEYSLLILFSRLFNIKENNQLDKNNLLIFIDEIDLYFHPEWQKQLISKLLEFFKIYFRDKKIHLIFTANNPLMISDMLSYNTIFLQKVDNNTTIINNSLTDHKNTFAANIHTLLSDSFFMKNGTMGDFAKNKLNDIIDQLNHKKGTISETERENIKKTIKLIGEPIIRKKLMSMYNECFYDDVISRIDRLEELMKKLGDDKN